MTRVLQTAGRPLGWGAMILSAAVLGCAAAPTAPAPAPPPAPTSAAAGATTIVAIAPPAPAPPAPAGLGIGRAIQGIAQGVQCVGQGIRNRLGSRFPGLESKPPIKAITDPANLGPDADPAAQAAAEIKAAEDGADQKIKALRYLARIGCGGCYPGVEEAFLSALEDCTEEVRYEAVKALRASGGEPCAICKAGVCCSEKIRKKLYDLGHAQDDTGCYREPSARVRRLARVGLSKCGGYDDVATVESPFPEEGPPGQPLETAPAPAPAPAPSPLASTARSGSGQGDGGARELALIDNASDVAMAAAKAAAAVQRVDFRAVLPQARKVVATVNDSEIQEQELLWRYVNENPQRPIPQGLKDLPPAFVREALDQAVRRKLLAQEALRNLSAEEVARIIAEGVPASQKVDSLLREELLAEAWLPRVRPANPRITAEAMRKRFQERFADRRAPARARWEQISVSKSDFASRSAALATIDFARRRALGVQEPSPANFRPEALRLAVQNWTALSRVPVKHRELIEQLQVEAVSPVMEDGEDLFVIRLLGRQAERPIRLDEVEAEVVASLREEFGSHFERIYVDQLRQRSRVWTILDSPAPQGAEPSADAVMPAMHASPGNTGR